MFPNPTYLNLGLVGNVSEPRLPALTSLISHRDSCCLPFQIRKKAGQQPDQREKRADPVHIFDAGAIGLLAKDRRSNAGDSKSESKEKSGYQSYFTRN